jgi:hypothetical protein
MARVVCLDSKLDLATQKSEVISYQINEKNVFSTVFCSLYKISKHKIVINYAAFQEKEMIIYIR